MKKLFTFAICVLVAAAAFGQTPPPGTCYFGVGGATLVCQSGASFTVSSGGTFTIASGATVSILGSTLSATEFGLWDGLTAGTVTASKLVLVDANKDIGDFRNLDAVNVDLGASGTAGSLDIFPTTAAKGKLSISAADSAGDTTTSIVNASQAGARTYTIPDAGASASFVMTAGAQTVAGVKTFSSAVTGTAGASISGGDVTVAADATGGNALAKNEVIGLPRIKLAGIGTMVNGSTNTVIVDIGDSETPATDWTAIDADVTMSDDATYYRAGTASLKMAVLTTATAGDGCTNTLGTGDQDWTDDESVGMWFYADRTLTAGDLVLVITDSVAGDTPVNFPAYATANKWEWIELDVSGVANASKDVITDLSIELSAAGAVVAAAGAFNCYFDQIAKWDGADEDSLGVAILQDGVLSLTVVDATDTGATSVNLVEGTDYIVHYQSGNDAIVMITDQSGADKVGLALVAY